MSHRINSQSRTIHLIDIENLCGQPVVTVERAREARAAYENRITIGEHDLIVVASSRMSAFAAYAVWPEARRLWRDGKDGADICLAQVITFEGLPERFNRVVLASGDGGFTEFVEYLTARNVTVDVVGLERHLAYRLAIAATRCITLDLPDRESPALERTIDIQPGRRPSFASMIDLVEVEPHRNAA